MIKLIIQLPKEGEKVTVGLEREGKTAQKTFPKNQMAEQLLETLDALLKENQLTPAAITDYVLETDLPENYTAFRIAKVTLDTWQWANKQKNQEENCG